MAMMIKVILLMIVVIVGLLVFTGCNRQSYDLHGGRISEYFPITLQDQFELRFNDNSFEKIQFTDAELMIVYRTISSFQFYGYNRPIANDHIILGVVHPALRIANEEHNTIINFTTNPGYRSFASVLPNDELNILKWFEVDTDAFNEIRELLIQGWWLN